ncbi:ribonuclease h [Fusarium langsethiae]|uniref:Ribonuclease h n=1 Tax=Fusarium langsethiae TaxID=179993 RepID=A0A0N1J346_FUSLA|nr:ribonuclease h [Fusarium langsethiae]GKU05388.1 unnamed protein product [Fusarium langsethiae]GKU21346.1 unnamed protein product [Fusarium langsethiae]
MVKKKSTYNWHAVAAGRMVGIVKTWFASAALVEGFPGKIHKGFYDLEEAKYWLSQYLPPGESVKMITDETVQAVDRSVTERVDLPKTSSQPGDTVRDVQKPSSSDDGICQPKEIPLTYNTSLSHKAFHAGVPSPSDPTVIVDRKLPSGDFEDSEDCDATSVKPEPASSVKLESPTPIKPEPLPAQNLGKHRSSFSDGEQYQPSPKKAACEEPLYSPDMYRTLYIAPTIKFYLTPTSCVHLVTIQIYTSCLISS